MLDRIRSLVSPDPESGSADTSTTVATIADPAKQIFEYKKQALALATGMAEMRGRHEGVEVKPTMTDYFIAAQRVGEQNAKEMMVQGIEWTPKVIADLSGQQVDGFQVNKADLQPPPAMRRAAVIRATATAAATGRKPSVSDALAAMQSIQSAPPAQQKAELAAAGIEGMRNMMDLDCDHAINQFFAEIDHHADFKGTVFSNVSFHPAGTLMRGDGNGVALTEGASFQNVRFDGMGADDHVVMAKGNYQNIAFTNIKGGQIEIADGTQIDGMNLRGAHASLSIGHAAVSNLDATDAHIVTLDAAPGALIANAKFDGATIDMASELTGSKWRNVSIANSNLGHVDMQGAELTNLTITNTATAQLDLRGATISNLTIDGNVITDRSQLTALGIQADQSTTVAASPEFVMNSRISAIGGTLHQAMASVNGLAAERAPAIDPNIAALGGTLQLAMASIASTSEPAARGQTTAEQAAAQLSTIRLQVADSSLSEALAGGHNQAKDLVARTQPEEVMSRAPTRES